MAINVSADLPTASEAGTIEYGIRDEFSGKIPFVIRERVISTAGSGSNGTPATLSIQLPANAVVTDYRLQAQTAIAGSPTAISVGLATDPDTLAELTFTGMDAAGDTSAGVVTTYAADVLASTAAQDIKITGTDGSGSAESYWGGTYDIAIWGYILQDFA